MHRWLRADAPAWQAQPLAQRVASAWAAAWGSLNARLSRAVSQQQGRALPDDPVLVLGPWRSGTTVMHELLAAASGARTPLTWQCMNACAFQLGQPPRADAGASPRPMDGLEVRADSPQEDEFALLSLGVASSYRAFLMPHRIGELVSTLDAQHWLADADWLPAWESFLRGVMAGAPAPDCPLLLKSPNHSFRLAAIVRRFPRARVAWMARRGADVAHSNRKMWSAMFQRYGMTAADPQALDGFLAASLHAAAAALEWADAQLPPSQCVVVRHEDLLRAPAATVGAVCERLALPRSVDASALLQAIELTARGRIERYDTALPADLAAAAERLDAAQAAVAARRAIEL